MKAALGAMLGVGVAIVAMPMMLIAALLMVVTVNNLIGNPMYVSWSGQEFGPAATNLPGFFLHILLVGFIGCLCCCRFRRS